MKHGLDPKKNKLNTNSYSAKLAKNTKMAQLTASG